MTKIGAQLARIQLGRAEITRQLESMKAEEEQRAIARGQHAVVSENASATQITAAFRRRSKNAHPVGVALSAFGLAFCFLNVP